MEYIFTQTGTAGELFETQNLPFSRWERFILSVFALLIAAIGIIGGWSFVLLLTDNTAGGGPLGFIANLLHFECLAGIG